MGRAWPKPGEPLFTDEDIDEILDYLALEDERCGGCGQAKAESFNPATEGRWRATPLRCHACTSKERAAGDFGPNEAPQSVYFAMALIEEEEVGHG